MMKTRCLTTSRKVRELLSDESKWIKGSRARDINHEDVEPEEKVACYWCLEGALCKVIDDGPLRSVILKTVQSIIMVQVPCKRWYDVVEFNDHEETTHDQIIKLIDNSIAFLEQKNLSDNLDLYSKIVC